MAESEVDPENSRVTTKRVNYTESVTCCCVSFDGVRILLGFDNGTLRLIDPITGSISMEISGHQFPILSVCFGPDDSYFVSSSLDSTTKIWNARNGEMKFHLQAAAQGCYICQWTDPARVLGYDNDTIWNVYIPNIVHTLQECRSVICRIVDDNGYFLLTQAENGYQIWDPERGIKLRALLPRRGVTNSGIRSKDNKFAIATPVSGKINICDPQSGQPIRFLRCPGPVLQMQLASDDNFFLTACGNGVIVAWDPRTGDLIRSLDFPFPYAGALAMDDSFLALANGTQLDIYAKKYFTTPS